MAILPNGIDLIPNPPSKRRSGRKSMLFFGRLHPVKGIEMLLQAWHKLAKDFPEWDLQIRGVDVEGYLPFLQEMVKEKKIERVDFGRPCFGDEKFALYQGSHLYVLPSYTENYAMTVAESLASGNSGRDDDRHSLD